MSKLVQIVYDTNCYDSYDSQAYLNLFKLYMIRIDTILKHIKTWNKNMTKYCKVEQMGDEMFETKWFLGSLRASQAIKKGKKFLQKWFHSNVSK